MIIGFLLIKKINTKYETEAKVYHGNLRDLRKKYSWKIFRNIFALLFFTTISMLILVFFNSEL
jgi:hypothetical protein